MAFSRTRHVGTRFDQPPVQNNRLISRILARFNSDHKSFAWFEFELYYSYCKTLTTCFHCQFIWGRYLISQLTVRQAGSDG